MTYKSYECHKLDTQTQVFFYEQEFYVLSNFSSFPVCFDGHRFSTSEHAYHWAKFSTNGTIQTLFEHYNFMSAHDAFKLANQQKVLRRPDWDNIKVDVMKLVLWAKVHQNEYVRTKLLETGDRQLIEDSWRDDVWGWGPNQDGQNLLGKCWMEIRENIRLGVPMYGAYSDDYANGEKLPESYAAEAWSIP